VGRYGPLLGFRGKAPAAKRFPGYYRGFRERWMRKVAVIFFSVIRPKSGGTVPPAPKSGGRRTPRTSHKLRLRS